MKKPNQEMYRLIRFAIKYPGWHSYAPDVARHIRRAVELEFLEIDSKTKQFRLKPPFPRYPFGGSVPSDNG